jgi:hypothetical protein
VSSKPAPRSGSAPELEPEVLSARTAISDQRGFTAATLASSPTARSAASQFRPYAFLEVGDEVADRYGQVWHFDEPWEWRRVYGGSTSTPVWPLVLLTLDGDPGRAANVKQATSAGSHDEEITRWRWLSDTTPLSGHP